MRLVSEGVPNHRFGSVRRNGRVLFRSGERRCCSHAEAEKRVERHGAANQRRAKLPGSPGATSTEPAGWCQVVSTRIPVSATMRSTMVARMAIAVRPKADRLLGPVGAVGEGLGSADTVNSEAEVEAINWGFEAFSLRATCTRPVGHSPGGGPALTPGNAVQCR